MDPATKTTITISWPIKKGNDVTTSTYMIKSHNLRLYENNNWWNYDRFYPWQVTWDA